MNKEEQKKLVTQLLKASNEIHKKRLCQDTRFVIQLTAKKIQEQADEYGVTFEEMVKIIEKELKGKEDEQ